MKNIVQLITALVVIFTLFTVCACSTQTNKGEPVISNKKAPSGKAYIEISRRILGENIEVSVPGRENGFFARLKRVFSKK